MPTRMSIRLGRWLVSVAGAVFFTSLLGEFYLLHIFLNSPLAPNQVTGQVIEWNNHGVFHYITANQQAWQSGLFVVLAMTFVLACVGVVLMKGRRAFNKRGD